MARRPAPLATATLVISTALMLTGAAQLGMLEQPFRDVPILRWLTPEGPATQGGADGDSSIPRPSTTAPRTPEVNVGAGADGHADLTSTSGPVHLEIPSLDVSAPILTVGTLPDGSMEIPDDVDLVGWYAADQLPVRPGDPGTAVIAGHRDSRIQGAGALHDIAELAPGGRIELRHEDGSVSVWEVDRILTTPRAELPAELLFSRDGPPRLALVTCGGTFDRTTRSYTHNTIVLASLVDPIDE